MLKKPEIGKMKEEFTLTLDKPHPILWHIFRSGKKSDLER